MIFLFKSSINLTFFNFSVKKDHVPKVLPILKKYQTVKKSKQFLSVPFTSLADYLWLLRACCESLATSQQNALLYLAAAVSDFYVPSEQLVSYHNFS